MLQGVARLIVAVIVFLGLAQGMSAHKSVLAQTEFKETVVTLDNGVVGTLVEPQTEGKVPAVLMLHGFASVRDEVGEMYKRLAAELGERGIASLRIDFRGWGESAGEMTDSTVQGMVDDSAAAYAYLTGLEFVDTERIGVIGFSLGGRIAIISAAQNPDGYQTMVLWSTGRNISPDFLGQEALDTANAEGQATVDLGWREVTLGKGFFESLSTYDMEQEFPKYTGSFLVIAGTEDESFNHLEWYLENAQGAFRAAYAVEGADHIYGVLGEDQTWADDVIEKTADWFSLTLG